MGRSEKISLVVWIRTVMAFVLVSVMSGCMTGCEPEEKGQTTTARFNVASPIAYDAGTFFLTIESETSWDLQVDYPEGQPQGWLTPAVMSGAGNKNVQITPDVNYYEDERSAVVRITPAQGDAVELSLTQSAYEAVSSLGVSLTSSTIAWNSTGTYLNIQATGSWTVGYVFPAGTAWCSSATAGQGNTSIAITAQQNGGTSSRTANITVTSGSESVTVTLTQSGNSSGAQPGTPDQYELPYVTDLAWYLEFPNGQYAIQYDITKKHPKWAAWQLTTAQTTGTRGSGNWHRDSRIPAQYSPVNDDYSGYDRGHMCPSGDRDATSAMNYETFVYSNASPQVGPTFNQTVWNTLENTWVRGKWMSATNPLYICTGGTIDDDQLIGYTSPSHMAIPKYYYKVILRKRNNNWEAIGFWMENKSYSSSAVTRAYVKSVRDIETLTGIDFFYRLPKADQDAAEMTVDPAAWGL